MADSKVNLNEVKDPDFGGSTANSVTVQAVRKIDHLLTRKRDVSDHMAIRVRFDYGNFGNIDAIKLSDVPLLIEALQQAYADGMRFETPEALEVRKAANVKEQRELLHREIGRLESQLERDTMRLEELEDDAKEKGRKPNAAKVRMMSDDLADLDKRITEMKDVLANLPQ